jgi:HEAT repeat protein
MRRYSSDNGYSDNWCAPGPVRVVLTVRGGAVSRARVFVGGNDSSSDVRDLGTVGTREAADYLLDLAQRAGSGVGDDAILAVVLADSVTPWSSLLSMARDDNVPRGTRGSAAFWLSRAAAAEVNHRPLFGERDEAESEKDEVRSAAIFALSQQPHDEGVPALIRVARGSSAPAARDRALFWLGQSGDPRALDLFAELLAVR